MSRIDDALRRLTGGVSPETRTSPGLDRFASEGGIPRVEEPRPAPHPEQRRMATVVPGPHPAKERPVALRAAAPPERVALAPTTTDAALDRDSEKLIDFQNVADYGGFVCRSVVRHKLLAVSTFGVVMLLAVVGTLLMPKTYHIDVKLLAQRNAMMTALSNPGRAVPWDADAPTRAAAETVLRRDNLISLVTQTDLINEWDRRRAPLGRFKDWARQLVTGHTMTADEKLDHLIYLLEHSMFVTAGPVGDGMVTIELYWPDAEMGYRIVERARQAYLSARQVEETRAISDSIAILQRYSDSLHQDVNRTLTELQATQAREKTTLTTRLVRAPRPVPQVATVVPDSAAPPTPEENTGPDPELARIKGLLAQKREELVRIEAERQKQLSELQAKLSALQTVYTSTHPSVVTLQQNIAAFQYESPQLVALRTSVDELETKYDEAVSALTARAAQTPAAPRPVATAARAANVPRETTVVEETPAPPRTSQAAEFASLRLRTELGQLQSILERTDGARIELAVSEAAFKYRYTTIKPAQIPREPESPNLRLMFIAGFLASVAFAIGATLGADLISNRILEAWQVERQLGLPILGSVKIA